MLFYLLALPYRVGGSGPTGMALGAVVLTVAAIAAKTSVLRQPRPYLIPAGGSSPVGVLGYVNAAFELADQIDAAACLIGGKIGRHAAHQRSEVRQVPRLGAPMHRHGADSPLLHVAQHAVKLE